ncbi:hypothetical protein [Sulfurimonas sp.]|uniref:hypothetical protein n=1 Tax=Sulfurimonas sp. TaxID=2022749 RepID=UPI0019FF15EA|nr:hypothetical protein [Sulfurimonas sp.]MBE0514589.1 hypothetical protein [Sulfurimonas sp.]
MDLLILILIFFVWLFNKLYWHYIGVKNEKLSSITIKLRDACIVFIFIVGAIFGSGIDSDAVFFRY